MTVDSVMRVKELVEEYIGKRVSFKVKKGKRRSQINEGIIADTYPSVFTIHVENKGFKRVMSFNYIDILTNNVEFFMCNEEKTRIM